MIVVTMFMHQFVHDPLDTSSHQDIFFQTCFPILTICINDVHNKLKSLITHNRVARREKVNIILNLDILPFFIFSSYSFQNCFRILWYSLTSTQRSLHILSWSLILLDNKSSSVLCKCYINATD